MRQKPRALATRGARNLSGENRDRLIVIEQQAKLLACRMEAQSRRCDGLDERLNGVSDSLRKLQVQRDRLAIAIAMFGLAYISHGRGDGLLKVVALALKGG